MDKQKVVLKCEVCDREYQHGPHKYKGHRLHLYGDLSCCSACWDGNVDGWAEHLEPVLLKHLEQEDLPVPERNAKGWLPRE
jgi:hypothetical protein